MTIFISKFNIPVYQIMIFISFLISYLIICFKLNKEKIPHNIIYLCALMSLVFTIIGAKLYTILTNLEKNYGIYDSGFSSIGGAIGLVTSIIIFNKIYSKNSKKILDVYIETLPLLYSISKLGCFLVGCCYGISYKGVFNIKYYFLKHSVFPIQIFESILFFILFIACLNLKKYKNEIIIMIGAILKFCLEFLRYSHINKFLSIHQIICLIAILVMCSTIFYKKLN